MPIVLIFARNLRSANAYATTEGIPWADREYVARPEQIRGRSLRRVERRFYGDWRAHPHAQAISDALFVCDMAEPVKEHA